MYYKIASIILNSAKATGLSDVYVAQPDSLKENLAGKLFVLAEIGGKKTDASRIFSFLIDSLNDNYYNDEKILFRGKIEGLNIENIFEAAITKVNKSLADFLLNEKIRINPAATNITLGVLYENKLHFSNFGKNRALLLFRHHDDFEVINVEANATETEAAENEEGQVKIPKFFSSVISGDIPAGSYFIFSSESLPEYLSSKEMVNIVTKLPPITAGEQIKNVLSQINNYVPFLGIIIKNTAGLPGQESHEEPEEENAYAAHESISSLNYTEQKTEEMLAPAGLINFSKMIKDAKQLIDNIHSKAAKPKKKYAPPVETKAPSQPVEVGSVKSLNMARSDSFLLKEKIIFKKKSGILEEGFQRFLNIMASLFNPRLWTQSAANFRSWIKNLDTKSRWLFMVLGAVVIIFVVNTVIIDQRRQLKLETEAFNNLVASLQSKETEIDTHLLYNDEQGAGQALAEAQAILSSLPRNNKEEQSAYQREADRLRLSEEKIQKLVRADAAKVNDFAGLGLNNIVFASGKIYAGAGQSIYAITPASADYKKTEIGGVSQLANPFFDGDRVYFWGDQKLISYNIRSGADSSVSTATLDASLTSYKIYNNYLYTIAKSANQIYRYSKDKTGYSVKIDWFKEPADMSQAVDLYVDQDIFILENNGAVLRYKSGKMAYSSAPISPVMAQASKLIAGKDKVYIFEPSTKRLAVLAKSNGALIKQYEVSVLSQPKDFAIDENGKAAYFLDDESLYKISLE